MEKEIWKDIKGYENLFQVSNLGNVRSLDKTITTKDGKIVTYKGRQFKNEYTDRDGYHKVGLTHCGKYKTVHVHRLVAIAFLGEPNDKTLVVNHIDSNPGNNRIENLEWVTQQQNCLHSFNFGKRKENSGENHRWAVLTNFQVLEIPKLRELGYSLHQISKLYNVSYSCIKNIASGRKWNYVSNNLED